MNININFNTWKKVIWQMKTISLIILFAITSSCVSIKITKDNFDFKYYRLKKTFTWMNPEIYVIIKTEAEKQKNNLPVLYKMVKDSNNKYQKVIIKFDFVKFICGIIMAESGEYCHNNYEWMKTVVSHAGATGIMQIMKVHTPNDPDSRKDPKINVQKGVMYWVMCVQKSVRENQSDPIRIACAYYNAGAGVKLWRYKNWGYVNKIERYYGKA